MHGTTPQPTSVGRFGRSLAIATALSVVAAGSAVVVAAQDDLDVLKIAHTATVDSWDPVSSFSTEAQYMANMYEPLLYATPAGAEADFVPGLATEWSTSDDGLTWTFTLAEGVTFHDGEPFNAEAAKASIDAARDSEGNPAGAWWIWPGIESIETPDEHTLVINLTSPAAMDLVTASTYAAWMVSPKALAARAEDPAYFDTAGTSFGTGPYMLEEHTPGTEVLLTQFPDYRQGWEDANHYEKVLVTITDPVNQQQALEGGQVDAANRIPPENKEQVDSNPDLTVHTDPSLFNYVGLINTQRPPLDDVRVRQALAYATPYEDIIAASTSGLAVQDRAAVPRGVFPYSESVPMYGYDIEKAKALMADAGVDGFDMEITYFVDNPIHAAYAPVLQASYADIGVNVELTPMTWTNQAARGRGEPDGRQDMFLLLYWPTYSDAGSDNLQAMFRSSETPSFNLSYWQNEEFDALIDKAVGLTGTDRAAAQATYEEAMKLLVDESPGLFFLDVPSVVATANHVDGYEYNLNYPFTQFFFYDLTPAA